MASVDDRIVRMEFDNASFEKKIASTLTSLGQLDKALKFTGATKGLSDVSAAADKVNFSTISDGIENVSKKFIALSTIAITVLSGITSQAVAAGEKLVKAFAIQPVLDGFKEYETNINSIQTILANTASKGTTLDQVTAALDKLNTYSDQTIYNFGQMAKNIGTFTAAGVDLQTSVDSIKGIANIAAMSGSSADQASTAMYQLSQAIASGSLKLMDWNSVVNAGMGGEAFKSALFETGKAMHTLTDVPAAQTFNEWEAAGHSFRDSLQDGWITADVLTTTLAAFTGDMTEEMLLQKGFSEAQALNIMKTAAIAKAAATEVKTFTQLVGTVQEAIGTGWADSFRIIIGNFTEAKALWTSVNNSIGAFVSQNANARNSLLQGWKDLGGRTLLIASLTTAFHNLGLILAPIRDAFRTIFPPETAAGLIGFTQAFARFTVALAPSASTVDHLRSIFQGLFSILSIGWTIIKEGTVFIAGLVKSLLGLAGPSVVGLFSKLGDGLTKLQDALVKGGGIKSFFAGLTAVLQKPLALLEKVKNVIGDLFSGFDKTAADKISSGVDRIGNRFQGLKDVLGNLGDIWQPFANAMSRVMDVLDRVWQAISNWFKELGKKIADTMKPGDFSAALDAINTALLGGIVALLVKFMKSGFKLDLGGGFFGQISGVLEQVTGTLKAMQAQIKANVLMKIAEAIAILTAAVVALSLIDSGALSRALTAMAVGFGELMTSFAALTKIAQGPKGAASFTLISVGMVALSASILILSGAVAILAQLSWEELAKGIGAIFVLLTGLTLITKPLAKQSTGMIAAGVGITALAIGLTILAVAVKMFGSMKMDTLEKGLGAIGIALLGIAGAMQLMPPEAPLMGAGLILVAVGLNILAGAVAMFGHMKWETLKRGFIGIGAGLLIIAAAMQGMPPTTPIIGAGLIIVSIGLGILADAVNKFGKMSWDEIARGLVALGGSLLILAVGLYAMSGTLGGAAALIVAAVGLTIFEKVLTSLGKMSWGDVLGGLGKLALALGGVALAALLIEPAVPALLALGIALTVLGIAFALFGAGAFLVGKGFEAIAKSGAAAAETLPKVAEAIGAALPALLKGFAKGIVDLVKVFTDAAPVFAKAIIALLDKVFTDLPKLIPKIEVVIRQLIESMFNIIDTYVPRLIQTGLLIIVSLLQGISDNIALIVTLAADIITKFLDQLSLEIPRITDSIVNFISTAFTNAAYALGLLSSTLLVNVGIAFIDGFMTGIGQSVSKISDFFGGLPGDILTWIGDTLGTLVQKGIDIITGLWNGITGMVNTIFTFFANLATSIFTWVGDTFGTLISKGTDLIAGLAQGIGARFDSVINWFEGLPGTISGFFNGALNWLEQAGIDIIQGLWNGIKSIWDNVKSWVQKKTEDLVHDLTHPWELFSPSHVTMRIGEGISLGLLVGLKNGWESIPKWVDDTMPQLADTMTLALSNTFDVMNGMEEFNPTITPVLDLTQVAIGAAKISDYMQASQQLTPAFSSSQARIIASDRNAQQEVVSANQNGSGNVSFHQVINAPTELSTSDIYKQTRNQITMAKEELSIP